MQSGFLKDRVGAAASYNRLERLIRKRLEPGADKDAIDDQIWELFGEEWAIMFTDLSGFSRRVAEFGIIHFLQTILESEQLFVPLIEAHGGVLLKVEGDSLLTIFRTPKSALRCAIAMQKATVPHNAGREDTEKVLLCVGLGYGRVLRIGDADVFGAEVNAASKLGEDTARQGEILVTESVRQVIEADPDITVPFEPLEGAPPPGATAAYRAVYGDVSV